MLKPHNHPVESHGRTALRNYIIQASTLLEIALSGLVLIGLLFSIVPLLKWMPGLLFDGNDAEIRTFLERALDIVIGLGGRQPTVVLFLANPDFCSLESPPEFFGSGNRVQGG